MMAIVSGVHRSNIMLTANITAGNRNETNEAEHLVPVVGADGDTESPSGRVETRLPGGLTKRSQVHVSVEVEGFGNL
jgi:hypothetical protein